MSRALFPSSQTTVDEVGPDFPVKAGTVPGGGTRAVQRGNHVATTEG